MSASPIRHAPTAQRTEPIATTSQAVAPAASPPPTSGARLTASPPPASGSAPGIVHATTITQPTGVAGTSWNGGPPRQPLAVSGVLQPEAPVIDPFLQDYVLEKNGKSSWPFEGKTGHLELAACGSAAATAVLSRHDLFATIEGIDQHTRLPNNLGGSFRNMIDFYKSRDLEARQYHGGSWDDLGNALRQGFSVVVTFSHEASQHTMLVTGQFKAADGKDYLRLQDWDGSRSVVMTKEEFERMWSELRLPNMNGIQTGVERTYAVIGPKGATLPRGGSTWSEINAISAETLHDAFTDLLSGVQYMKHGEIGGGLCQITSGVIQGAIQLPAGIVQISGAGLEWLGDKGLDWAKRQFKEPSSFIAKVGAIFAFIFAGLAFVLGKGLRYTGQLVGALTGLLGRLLAYPFGRLGEWLHQDNEAEVNVRFADKAGSLRAQLNYYELVRTKGIPGKLQLLEQMASGRVSGDERAMMARVLEAAKDPLAPPGEYAALVNAFGTQRLASILGTAVTPPAPPSPPSPVQPNRMTTSAARAAAIDPSIVTLRPVLAPPV